MKLTNKKVIQILPDGSLFFNYSNILKPKQTVFLKKSHTNFSNKKLKSPTTLQKSF